MQPGVTSRSRRVSLRRCSMDGTAGGAGGDAFVYNVSRLKTWTSGLAGERQSSPARSVRCSDWFAAGWCDSSLQCTWS